MLVVGIDAGGTKSVGYLANERAEILAEARAAGANHLDVGDQGVEATLREIVAALFGNGPVDVAAACLGIAGVDRPQEGAEVRAIFARILPATPLVVVNDALVALEAGAPGQAGLVVV